MSRPRRTRPRSGSPGARPSTARTSRCGSSTAAADCGRRARGGVGVHGRRAPAPGVGHQRGGARGVDGGAEERLLPVGRASAGESGSSGFVRQDGADQGYAITVMTEGATNQRTGIRLTEEVARRAAAALTVGPGENRPIDRAKCVLTSGGESWAGVAARLGLPSSRAGEVRTTAGGNPSPLSGQQACSPDIPGEPMSPTSVGERSLPSGRHRPRLRRPRRPPLVRAGRGGRHVAGPVTPTAASARGR